MVTGLSQLDKFARVAPERGTIDWGGDGRTTIMPPDGAPGRASKVRLGQAREYVNEALMANYMYSRGTMLWVLEDFCRQHNIAFVTTTTVDEPGGHAHYETRTLKVARHVA